MKRTLLMLLVLLMVFSVISCEGNTPSSNEPATVNVKVDIKTEKSINEIQKYGNLYTVILTGSKDEFNFINLTEITKQESSFTEPVKLKSDKTDIYVYLNISREKHQCFAEEHQ